MPIAIIALATFLVSNHRIAVAGVHTTLDHATQSIDSRSAAESLETLPDRVQFSRGRMSGTAVGMTYDKNQDVVLLQDQVVVAMPAGEGESAMQVTGGGAEFRGDLREPTGQNVSTVLHTRARIAEPAREGHGLNDVLTHGVMGHIRCQRHSREGIQSGNILGTACGCAGRDDACVCDRSHRNNRDNNKGCEFLGNRTIAPQLLQCTHRETSSSLDMAHT